MNQSTRTRLLTMMCTGALGLAGACGGQDGLHSQGTAGAPPLGRADAPLDDALGGGGLLREEGQAEPAPGAMMAQAPARGRRAPAPVPAPVATSPTEPPGTASDATSQPLVIYRASLHLAVYQVQATQSAILEHVESLGGRLSRRTDEQLELRVPAARFEEALGHTEEQGDVLHRDVTAQDVGEEYRDLEIRIRNLEIMRTRLEALLAQADDIEAALAIERELQRLTVNIERMKGRVRYLANQVAFSTITIFFQAKQDEDTTPDTFRLPFAWLDQLGLQRLMRLQ